MLERLFAEHIRMLEEDMHKAQQEHKRIEAEITKRKRELEERSKNRRLIGRLQS